MTSANVLLYDLECSPITAHVWGLRDQFIGLNQIRQQPRVIGAGAKWLGARSVMWKSEYHDSRLEMLTWTRDLLDKADVVGHYNGTSFDTPWLLGEFAREDIDPPSPFKQVDLYRVARKAFRFPSYKLQYVSTALGLEGKQDTGGHDLWVKCLESEGEEQRRAWAKMRRYCKQDVALLEPLWHKLRPYFPASINFALWNPEGGPACSKCGSDDFQWRGYTATAQRFYRQLRCNECGGWSRLTTVDPDGTTTTGIAR